jgi:hypothetical protein
VSETVREAISADGGLGWETACRVLGVDPDMDLDTLRRRFTYGERVEQAIDVLDRTVLKSAYRDAQRDLLAWLRSPAGSSGTETT